MFNHSIRVPRVYKVSAQILQKVVEESASIKELVYGNKKHPNVKGIYSLVVNTLQNTEQLEELFKKTELLVKEPRLDPWLTKILVTELLWGKKRLSGDSKPVQTIVSYKEKLETHLDNNTTTTKAISKVVKPRYVRVNTLLTSVKEAIDGFSEEGWNLIKCSDKKNYDEFLEKVSNLGESDFMVDIHVPSVLIFPPKTEFYSHEAYKTTKILLQDKASCLPAKILNPPSGSVILDMCAAPGMKTTQLAACIKNKGTIYAVERDERRYEILKDLVRQSGATCVQTFNEDVLRCDSTKFPNVEYILVDPSCSGSGMTERPDFEKEANVGRLNQLAGFQIKILRHAMLKFPTVKRIVYSTCSIYPQENEDVVRQVLETNYTFKLVPAKQFIEDAWKNFGGKEFGELGKYCLYAKPNEDFTNGFFLAVFERLETGEENQFFNHRVFDYKKMEEHRRRQKLKMEKTSQKYRKENNVGTVEETSNGFDEENEDQVKNKKKKVKNNKWVSEDENQQSVENMDSNDYVKPKKKKEKIDEINNEDLTVKKGKKKDNDQLEETVSHDEDVVKTKKKKKKKQLSEGENDQLEENVINNKDNVETKKKKKKRQLSESKNDQILEENRSSNYDVVKTKKNKKKRQLTEGEDEQLEENVINNEDKVETKKKKKKRQLSESKNDQILEENRSSNDDVVKTKKNKKKRQLTEVEDEQLEENVKNNEDIIETKKKKKKKQLCEDANEQLEEHVINNENNVKTKKKKKKKQLSENENEHLLEDNETNNDDGVKAKKKKKNKQLSEKTEDTLEEPSNQSINENLDQSKTKKKKKIK